MVKTSARRPASAGHIRETDGPGGRGHAISGHRGRRKNNGCAITLVNIAIQRHGGTDFFISLHAADRDRNVVDHAEAFAVIGEGMMKPAANADRDAVVERIIGGQHRSAGGHPECAHQLRRVWNLHLQFLARAERAGFQFLHVLRRVYQQNVFIGGGTRSNEVGGVGHIHGHQSVVYASVLLTGKYVVPDGQEIIFAIDKLKGQHAAV